ncbi:hypothetical protein [Streptomyces reniochalinae]|uniref:hypothetical protein n=1 Tax=Streptomyces reniochalinae TaxID=2250578 RepID=UPI0015F02D78|nr:hypothetical protein [Streptomyces reniochalinae]
MNRRRTALLAAIRDSGGTWTTRRAWTHNRTHHAPNRATARGDLAWTAGGAA